MDSKIEKIISEFDFQKVHGIMGLLDWKYFDSEKTPTVEKLKDTAITVLKQALVNADKHSRVACGGFIATKVFYFGTGNSVLHLDFVVESKFETYNIKES